MRTVTNAKQVIVDAAAAHDDHVNDDGNDDYYNDVYDDNDVDRDDDEYEDYIFQGSLDIFSIQQRCRIESVKC